jgi:recombination protein RecA
MLRLSQSLHGDSPWKPASQVLTRVRAVKTIFVQFNRATRVGGYPIQRFTMLHGPSSHGKTTFAHGLGLSFLQQQHFYSLVDAEYTTPISWLEEIMGEYAHHPGFNAMRPESYEQTVTAVEDFMRKVADARDAEEDSLPSDTSALVVVDSMKKLIPQDIWKRIVQNDADTAKGSVDGMGGRMAQIQAAMNTAWLNRLTPLLDRTNTGLLAILRESENIGHSEYEPDYKVQGGKSVIYDSSLGMRVVLAGYIKDPPGSKEGRIIGERHRLILNKTKVAKKEDKGAVCYFHTSNGAMVPEGFDRARDVLELAREYGIVDLKGQWLTWRNCRWQGVNAAVRKLAQSDNALTMLQADVEARFSPDEVLPTPTAEDNIEARA